jgi:hypothetical protein
MYPDKNASKKGAQLFKLSKELFLYQSGINFLAGEMES